MSQTLPAPNEPQSRAVQSHFDRLGRTGYWADLYAEYANPAVRWSFARRQMCLEEMMADLAVPGARVVEIGPGTGNLVRYFAARGCEYRGYDNAESMAIATRDEIARQPGLAPGSTCEVADIAALPLPDGHADLVLASGVFEYLDDPAAAARELARVTRGAKDGRPGGTALITLPNARSVSRILGKRLDFITGAWHGLKRMAGKPIGAPDVHRWSYTKDSFMAAIADCGWAFSRQTYYDIEVLPYPITRIAPAIAFAAKQRVELAGRGPQDRLGNGLILQLTRR